MIFSRGYHLLKSFRGLHPLSNPGIGSVRRSHGNPYPKVYRTVDPPSEYETKLANITGTLIWAWIIYHFINDYDHYIGEYYEPDPSLWTDEELGVPPDDAEV